MREIRKRLGLTLKDVEHRSRQLVESRQNPDYLFTAGRLSQVESSGSLPSIYKLAALSEIYGTPYAELLQVYGIEALGSPIRTGSGNTRPAADDSAAAKPPVAVWI